MKSCFTIALVIVVLSCHLNCIAQRAENQRRTKKDLGIYEKSESGRKFSMAHDTTQVITLDTTSNISFNEIEKFGRYNDSRHKIGTPFFIKLNPEGTKKLAEMSERNLGGQIYFVVKDKIIAAPVLVRPITEGKSVLRLPQTDVIAGLLDYLGAP